MAAHSPATRLQQRLPTKDDVATYGTREDGSPKGPGFFGGLRHPEGMAQYSTEFSITTNLKSVPGKDVAIPLLVPSLSMEEIEYLVKGGKPTRAIVDKAAAYADARVAKGLSPFATFGEQHPLPASPETAFNEGFDNE